jgi:hypothetical protein
MGWRRINVNKIVSLYFENLYIQSAIIVTTIAAIALAIVETYISSSEFKDVALSLEIFFFCVFFVDLMADFLRAQFKLDYLLSLTFFYDITACLSLLWVFYPKSEWLIFFRFFRIFKLVEIVKLRHISTALAGSRVNSTDIAAFQTTGITYFLTKLIVNIVAFVIISTAAVYALSISDPESFTAGALTFGSSFYFIIITITTVGFGDISPVGIIPELLVVVIVIFAFSVFPFQVSEMVEVMHSKGERNVSSFKTRRHTEHIVVAGLLDYESLYVIASQVLPPHAGDFGGLVLCILSPTEPSPRVATLLAVHKQYIQFLVGSSKSFNDLRRSRAHKARAIVVLPDIVEETSLREEEDSVFLSAVAITKYLDNFTYSSSSSIPRVKTGGNSGMGSKRYPYQQRAKPRVIVKLTSSARNRPVLLASGVDCVLAVAELRYTLLAFGSAMPGFIAMFNSLIGWNFDIKKMGSTESDGRRHSTQTVRQVEVSHFPAGVRAMPWASAVLECYQLSHGNLTLVAAKRGGDPPAGAVLIPPAPEALLGSFECVFAIGDTATVSVLTNGGNGNGSGNDSDNGTHNLSAGNADATGDGSGPDEGKSGSSGDDFTAALVPLARAFSASTRRDTRVTYRSPSFLAASTHGLDFSQQARGLSVVTGPAEPSGAGSEVPLPLLQRLPSDSAIGGRGSFYFGTPKHIAPVPAPVPASAASGEGTEVGRVRILNRFAAAEVAGTSKGSAGKRFVPASLKERQGSRLTGHILVAITATNSETIPANAIMLPLLYYLRSLRNITGDPIVVLCDRADELVGLVPEVELVSPGVMADVRFVHGFARNPDHLNLVNAERARAAVILRPPLASEQSQEGVRDKSFVAKVGADKDTIICSLNLHLLLQQSKRLFERTPLAVSMSGEDIRLSPSASSRFDLVATKTPSFASTTGAVAGTAAPPSNKRSTHILVEIVHESNGKFLRQNTPSDPSAAAAAAGDYSDSADFDAGVSQLADGDDDNIFADASIGFLEELDLPMLQAGRILSHLTLDTLAVQAIFEPFIMAFWETALGLSSDPLLRAADEMTWGETEAEAEAQTEKEKEKEEEEEEEEEEVMGKDGLHLSMESEDDDEEKGTDEREDEDQVEGQPEQQRTERKAPSRAFVTSQPHFDLVSVPPHLVGSTFGEAFVWLYRTHGATAVAVHRADRKRKEQLPLVMPAPLPPSMILLPSDELFLIL